MKDINKVYVSELKGKTIEEAYFDYSSRSFDNLYRVLIFKLSDGSTLEVATVHEQSFSYLNCLHTDATGYNSEKLGWS